MSNSTYREVSDTINDGVSAAMANSIAASGSRTRRNTSSSESGDEEQDEAVSSPSDANQNELNAFRAQWKNEISTTLEGKIRNLSVDKAEVEEDKFELERKAKRLYLEGEEFEHKGLMYEAIQFYRKAVQLVPDIELRLYQATKSTSNDRTDNDNSEPMSTERHETSQDDNQEEEEEGELLTRFARTLSRSPTICFPAVEQSGTHISSLPVEIILLIFRWVVSCDLDLRSLEMCGLVCRGFYLCSRDSEIWRLICLRIWRSNCGGLSNYISWREMYLERPHLRFNGCYISKTTYYRQGENSFQDRSYRPVHVVEYYRYFRFFPEGTVLMLNTPDIPAAVVGHLRYRDPKHSGVFIGHFRLLDNCVSFVTSNQKTLPSKSSRSNRLRPDLITSHKGVLELRKSRQTITLQWKMLELKHSRGSSEFVTSLDVIKNNKFPGLKFFPVKSYCTDSNRPLM